MKITRKTAERRLMAAALTIISATAFGGNAPLFTNTTGELKKADGTTWKLTVTETERQPRYSIIRITHEGRMPSVGSSMFIACSVLSLAHERGFRYVAQLESSGTMKIGFLDKLEDDPAKVVGAEFIGLASTRKYDAEQFAPVCDLSKK